jgi:hypothetical protein
MPKKGVWRGAEQHQFEIAMTYANSTAASVVYGEGKGAVAIDIRVCC